MLVKTFGLGVLDLDNVTVQHFLAIMAEEAKAANERSSAAT